LLQGAASDKELRVVRDLANVPEMIGDETQTWLEAGSLSNRLRKRGITVGLSDCLIACAARGRGSAVMTLDAHFKSLQEELGIELVS
jgi:predicted nucleic acid-binding protein